MHFDDQQLRPRPLPTADLLSCRSLGNCQLLLCKNLCGRSVFYNRKAAGLHPVIRSYRGPSFYLPFEAVLSACELGQRSRRCTSFKKGQTLPVGHRLNIPLQFAAFRPMPSQRRYHPLDLEFAGGLDLTPLSGLSADRPMLLTMLVRPLHVQCCSGDLPYLECQ
jgi:hypothetical protein